MSSKFALCPGLFSPSAAQDGLLSRLRIPGGLLTVPQCEAIADLADRAGNGTVQITNRANVQIRALQAGLSSDALKQLQAVGLASPLAAVDALRNIMSSPTAGIDRQQLLDTRPLVAAWNRHLATRPDFAVLSPKFSVCFDGGEAVSVRDRPNDISLVAEAHHDDVLFRLHLSLGERGDAPCDVGVLVNPQESLPLLTAMAEIYRDYTTQMGTAKHRKPRLRALLHDWGVNVFLKAVESRLSYPLQRSETLYYNTSLTDHSYQHLGIHAQQQPGFSYIGIVIPLGHLQTQQWRALATLATRYGSGSLRLTPWQNVLLSDLSNAHIVAVQQDIEWLGLHTSATDPHSAIVACSGITGCNASATDTQANALTLGKALKQRITLDRPINIHFSGCEKSCAQHHASDIMLLGVAQGDASYHVYIGDHGANFGRSLYQNYPFSQLPDLIERMLRTYQTQRSHPNETFREFVNRRSIAALKQLFNAVQIAH